MCKCWSKQVYAEQPIEPTTVEHVSFSTSVKKSVERLESNLFDLLNDLYHLAEGSPLSGKLRKEMEQYFMTGKCDGSAANDACPNPTFLEPVTGQWHVHFTACPFEGYLPLPWKILDATTCGNKGMILSYCQMELKKLLIAFRKRIADVKFSFYPCDALDLCYQDSPLKFDVIAASDLGDHVGIVNVLNAATRKLRSARSILITETVQWTNVAPTVSKYVQEALCCPLSLIPTIYGLRLMDDLELGPEFPPSIKAHTVLPTRLRWKIALALEGVPLVLSPHMEQSLKKLKDECFRLTPAASTRFQSNDFSGRCGMVCYSPLTFRYVVSDMIRRGGFQNPASLMSSSLFRLPPVFEKSVETSQAWMDHRPIWRVKVCSAGNSIQQQRERFEKSCLMRSPVLRLILIPLLDFLSTVDKDSAARYARPGMKESDFYKLDSTKNHFFDNLEVSLIQNAGEMNDHVEVSFLLHDLDLLKSYCGVLVGVEPNGSPSFILLPLSTSLNSLESFSRPFPSSFERSLPTASPNSQFPMLVPVSCKESERNFNIRFNYHRSSADEKPPTGNIIHNSVFYN